MDQRGAHGPGESAGGDTQRPEGDRSPMRAPESTAPWPAPSAASPDDVGAPSPTWTWPVPSGYPETNRPPGTPVPDADAPPPYRGQEETTATAIWPDGPADAATATIPPPWAWPDPQHYPAPYNQPDRPDAQAVDPAWAAYWAGQREAASDSPAAFGSNVPPYTPTAIRTADTGNQRKGSIALFIIAAVVIGGAALILVGYLAFGRSGSSDATPTTGAVVAPSVAQPTAAPTSTIGATATRAATVASAPSPSAATVLATAASTSGTAAASTPPPATPRTPTLPAIPIILPPTFASGAAATPGATALASPVAPPPMAIPATEPPPAPTEPPPPAPVPTEPPPPPPAPTSVVIPTVPVVNNPPPPPVPTPVPTVAAAPTSPPPPTPVPATQKPAPAQPPPPTTGPKPTATTPPGFIQPAPPKPVKSPADA